MHWGFLVIAACGWGGRSAQLTRSRKERGRSASTMPSCLLKVRLTPAFPHVRLPIVLCLIDVDWGHLSSCRGSRHSVQGAKCLHAFIWFYPRVCCPRPGSDCGRADRAICHAFFQHWIEGQSHQLRRLVRENKYSLWEGIHLVFLSLSAHFWHQAWFLTWGTYMALMLLLCWQLLMDLTLYYVHCLIHALFWNLNVTVKKWDKHVLNSWAWKKRTQRAPGTEIVTIVWHEWHTQTCSQQ